MPRSCPVSFPFLYDGATKIPFLCLFLGSEGIHGGCPQRRQGGESPLTRHHAELLKVSEAAAVWHPHEEMQAGKLVLQGRCLHYGLQASGGQNLPPSDSVHPPLEGAFPCGQNPRACGHAKVFHKSLVRRSQQINGGDILLAIHLPQSFGWDRLSYKQLSFPSFLARFYEHT